MRAAIKARPDLIAYTFLTRFSPHFPFLMLLFKKKNKKYWNVFNDSKIRIKQLKYFSHKIVHVMI